MADKKLVLTFISMSLQTPMPSSFNVKHPTSKRFNGCGSRAILVPVFSNGTGLLLWFVPAISYILDLTPAPSPTVLQRGSQMRGALQGSVLSNRTLSTSLFISPARFLASSTLILSRLLHADSSAIQCTFLITNQSKPRSPFKCSTTDSWSHGLLSPISVRRKDRVPSPVTTCISNSN